MTYNMILGPYAINASIQILNEKNDCSIGIESVCLFNTNSMEYAEVESTPEQIRWFERQVAQKIFEYLL